MEITLKIADDSALGRNIERISEAEQLSREEAALRLLEEKPAKTGASAEARKIIGAFSSPEDVALMDEAMQQWSPAS